MFNEIVLSVIVPIKISKFNTFLYARLERFINYFERHSKIEYVIVDSTEINKYSQAIKACAHKAENTSYVYLNIDEPYSSAKARNCGASIASGNYLVFFDIDLLAKKNYFLEVLGDVESLLSISKEAFTIYPCLYLTCSYSSYLENNFDIKGRYDLSDELNVARNESLKGLKDKVLYPAINTSTILVNKQHFFNIGGYDEGFSGHGYEDFFLIHLLSYYYPLAIKEKSYFLDDKTDYPGLYRGFRRYFSYYSLENLFKGMFTVHLFHERVVQRTYYKKRDYNSMFFQSKLQELGIDIYNQDSIIYDDYQKFISHVRLKYGFNREHTSGLYRPLLSKNLSSRLYRLYRKTRKLALNPKQFFKDIRFDKYKH